MTTSWTRDRRGMTLIEMMIALTMFTIVLGGAMSFLRYQSRGFRIGSDRAALIQNLRYAADFMAQDLRTAGANVPDEQPVIIYAGEKTISFNADYATLLSGDPFAVYYDPDAPLGATTALLKSQRQILPGTDMAYPDTNYRQAGGVNSEAETLTFFFQLDTATARTDDYVLYRQINHLGAEVVSRNLLQTTGLPFLQYYRRVMPANAPVFVALVATGLLPAKHTKMIHMSPSDTGAFARIDSLVGTRVNFTVTNGLTGVDERIRTITRLVWLPNVGKATRLTCGDEPLPVASLTATPVVLGGGDPGMSLAWNAALDEASGEKDVVRYVLWRRILGALEWGETYQSLPAGLPNYVFVDDAVTAATTYQYALAAQDCTPKTSSLATAAGVIP